MVHACSFWAAGRRVDGEPTARGAARGRRFHEGAARPRRLREKDAMQSRHAFELLPRSLPCSLLGAFIAAGAAGRCRSGDRDAEPVL